MAEKRSGARSGSASRNHLRSWHGDDPIPRTADGIDARIFRPGQASAQPATPPQSSATPSKPPVDEDNPTKIAPVRPGQCPGDRTAWTNRSLWPPP